MFPAARHAGLLGRQPGTTVRLAARGCCEHAGEAKRTERHENPRKKSAHARDPPRWDRSHAPRVHVVGRRGTLYRAFPCGNDSLRPPPTSTLSLDPRRGACRSRPLAERARVSCSDAGRIRRFMHRPRLTGLAGCSRSRQLGQEPEDWQAREPLARIVRRPGSGGVYTSPDDPDKRSAERANRAPTLLASAMRRATRT